MAAIAASMSSSAWDFSPADATCSACTSLTRKTATGEFEASASSGGTGTAVSEAANRDQEEFGSDRSIPYPAEARALVPKAFHPTFAAGDLEIYAKVGPKSAVPPAGPRNPTGMIAPKDADAR